MNRSNGSRRSGWMVVTTLLVALVPAASALSSTSSSAGYPQSKSTGGYGSSRYAAPKGYKAPKTPKAYAFKEPGLPGYKAPKTYEYKEPTLPEYHAPRTYGYKAPAVPEYKTPKTDTSARSSPWAQTAPRDSHGRLVRSEAAKDDFKRSNPCPSTGTGSGSCPGYVVDHVVPLKEGGADAPNNMQWQTQEAAKEKDKSE
jgi:hypothetical protein